MKELLSCEQTSSWFHPSLHHSSNLLSLLMKLLIHIHVLIFGPYILFMDVTLVGSQPIFHPSTNSLSLHGLNSQPGIYLPPFSIFLSFVPPPLRALSIYLFFPSQPLSLYLLHFIRAPLFSVCLRKGITGMKEKRESDRYTNRSYNTIKSQRTVSSFLSVFGD